jgi:hypothetical protein
LFSVVTGTLRAPEKEVFKPGIVALSRYVDQAECMIARTHIQIRCHSSMVSYCGVLDRRGKARWSGHPRIYSCIDSALSPVG